jgi:multidrug efflux pump subunit AcrA (membrane-fusion protein)
VLAALIVLGASAGCGTRDASDASAAAKGAATPAGAATPDPAAAARPDSSQIHKPIAVTVAPVMIGDLVHSVSAEGRLRARREVEIQFELSGTLERLMVDEGERVRAGEVLAQLDQREYRAALEEARARHLRALSELAVNLEAQPPEAPNDTALGDYREGIEALRRDLRTGRVSYEDYRDRSQALELEALQRGAFRRHVLEARTGFAEAKAADERAQLNFERTEIRAPFDGTVTGLDRVAGEKAYAGQTLCRLIDTRDLEAEVHVLESDLGSLQVGHPALLTITAVDVTLPVRVSVVSPDVDAESRTCRVLLRFANDDPRIRPGMFARAEIATEVLSQRRLVPREAVLTREDRPLVFKVVDDRAIWVYVETGARNDTYIEVTGVAPGATLEPEDRVVVSDHLTLAHEAAVSVARVVRPKDPWRTSFGDEED